MAETTETLDRPDGSAEGTGPLPALPGLLLVYAAGRPALAALPLPPKRPLEIGRAMLSALGIDDPAVSRQHARVSCADGAWTARDLGSRNGTAVDGLPVVDERTLAAPRVLRTGGSLFLFRDDVRPFLGAAIEVSDAVVMGPTLGKLMATVARAAAATRILHIAGESGTGKELVARAFHRFGPRPDGPFIAVNCANIPQGLAERLLFGVRRGAYSGASSDAIGYLQSAHEGTLFLDEVAELDPQVQAKVLRTLETQEILPLGAPCAKAVRVRVCSATHRSLAEQVRQGLFREDLYYRIGRPSVLLPALRERAEEIPWLIERELAGMEPPRSAHVSLIEEFLLRRWPGNVRELLIEVHAAIIAAGDGPVEGRHLALAAGNELGPDHEGRQPGGLDHDSAHDDQIRAALRREGGNVSRAALALGLHRTQLRRWIARNSNLG